MSKGDMLIFDRKTRWYEKHHARMADRRIVISPMVRVKVFRRSVRPATQPVHRRLATACAIRDPHF
jgi:hypothetical protein